MLYTRPRRPALWRRMRTTVMNATRHAPPAACSEAAAPGGVYNEQLRVAAYAQACNEGLHAYILAGTARRS